MTLDQAMRDLGETRSADEVARSLLPAIRGQVEERLAALPGASPQPVRRAYLTLLGPQGSEGLISDPSLTGGEPGAGQRSSRIALEAVRERRIAVCLDIPGRRLFRGDGGVQRLNPEQVRGGTVTRLDRLAITHLLAMPLRAPGRRLLGVLSLELSCPDLIEETAGLVSFAADRLQVQVDLATLHMALLPRELPRVDLDGLRLGGAMRGLLEQGHAHLTRREPVLLLGERGVGKRWLARQMHLRGGWGGPLDLLEGTDVSEMELDAALRAGGLVVIHGLESLQHPLQRLLASRLRTEGEGAPRVVCTSTFQRFRLASSRKVVPELWALLADEALSVPTLQQRNDEIPYLVQDFLAERATETGDPDPVLADGVLDLLQRGPWPDNLAGLRAFVRGLWARAELRWSRGGLAGGEREITLSDVHDLRAATEPPLSRAVLRQLQPGCKALAARMQEPGAGLNLDMLQGLTGLVLAEALEQDPDPWRLATRLGYKGRRRGGNYLKPMRVAADWLRALCEALGEPVPPALRAIEPKKTRRA